MEEKQFSIVSNNKVYFCNGMDALKEKTRVLDVFEITYEIYYLNKGEWVKMMISSTELFKAFEKGLRDSMRKELKDVIF